MNQLRFPTYFVEWIVFIYSRSEQNQVPWLNWRVLVTVPEDMDADVDEDTQALLTSDFEIGHYIRERIVPRAVLYYTGEWMKHHLSKYGFPKNGVEMGW